MSEDDPWRPIHVHPKDRERFKGWNGNVQLIATWSQPYYGDGGGEFTGEGGLIIQPPLTHYKPLGPPPGGA